MTAKSIAYLFLILSIINLPLVICYNIETNKNLSASAVSSFFFRYSIGNIGQETPICLKNQFNTSFNDYADMTFECPDGKISQMKLFGFP